ncbi:segregation and condensation protein A [Zavarzinia sp. CC-PAN008]|uniref:segregation and condensation protein A n=1 Tax=Zavarzinia sp. CC-PAN008 TaxID=3243332 RepID=UPI003F74A073
MAQIDAPFEDPPRQPAVDPEALLVDLGGFEGPLDVLLVLARGQKVDLRQISILALAEQYLAFVLDAKRRRLELAADYLVMAAWLAYLKSRLLLPEKPKEGELSAQDMADRLARQLARLEVLRRVAGRLMARPQLGREVFARGAPEPVEVTRNTSWHCTLHDLLQAYARQRLRPVDAPFQVGAPILYSIEAALDRLSLLIGESLDWLTLEHFLPPELQGAQGWRAGIAGTLAASLELAKQGVIELQQDHAFGPIRIKRVDGRGRSGA